MKINHEVTKVTKKDRESRIEDREKPYARRLDLQSSILDHLRALRCFVVDFGGLA
jgi:hypothetical protein